MWKMGKYATTGEAKLKIKVEMDEVTSPIKIAQLVNHAVTRIRTRGAAATTQSTDHYTITASSEKRFHGSVRHEISVVVMGFGTCHSRPGKGF